MRPLRDIKRVVGHAEIRSEPRINGMILDDLLKELATSRNDASVPTARRLWSSLVHNRLVPLAAMVAVVCVVAVVLHRHASREPVQPPTLATASSAADLLTVGHLNAACRRGGLPEIERQCERATQRLQIRPERVSTEQLIREMTGT
jgi:hypothetical protein